MKYYTKKRVGTHKLQEPPEDNSQSRNTIHGRSFYSKCASVLSDFAKPSKGLHSKKAERNGLIKKNSLSPYKVVFAGAVGLFLGIFGFVGSSNGTVSSVATTVNQSATQSVTSGTTQVTGNWGGVTFSPGFEADRIINLANKSSDSNPPVAAGNNYVPGQCTWYAYNRRAQLGYPIQGSWGNAGEWAISALSSGYAVDHNPVVGDVIVTSGNSSYGHVAVVEKILPNNTVWVSEMNYGGPFVYHESAISDATSYYYIHNKL